PPHRAPNATLAPSSFRRATDRRGVELQPFESTSRLIAAATRASDARDGSSSEVQELAIADHLSPTLAPLRPSLLEEARHQVIGAMPGPVHGGAGVLVGLLHDDRWASSQEDLHAAELVGPVLRSVEVRQSNRHAQERSRVLGQ